MDIKTPSEKENMVTETATSRGGVMKTNRQTQCKGEQVKFRESGPQGLQSWYCVDENVVTTSNHSIWRKDNAFTIYGETWAFMLGIGNDDTILEILYQPKGAPEQLFQMPLKVAAAPGNAIPRHGKWAKDGKGGVWIPTRLFTEIDPDPFLVELEEKKRRRKTAPPQLYATTLL